MEHKNLNEKLVVELNDDALEKVSGGCYEYEEPQWGTCPYCAGRIYFWNNGALIPSKDMKCSLCGYMPSDPSTIPSMEDIIGG